MKSSIDRMKSQVANLSGVWMESSMIGKHSIFSPAPTISNTFSQLPLMPRWMTSSLQYSHPQRRNTSPVVALLKPLPSTKQFKSLLRHFVIPKITRLCITNDAFIREGGTVDLTPGDRTHYRYAFKKKLCSGLELMGINIFGRMRSGSGSPSCILVWKIPLVNGYDHAGNIQVAIEKCRNIIPKQIQKEAA